jgi:hypothetical protein
VLSLCGLVCVCSVSNQLFLLPLVNKKGSFAKFYYYCYGFDYVQKDLNLFCLILRTIDEAFVLFDPFSLARFHRKKFRRPRKSRNSRSIRIAIVVCRPLGEQCEDLTDLSATNFSESPELPARLCRDLLEQALTGNGEDWNLLC